MNNGTVLSIDNQWDLIPLLAGITCLKCKCQHTTSKRRVVVVRHFIYHSCLHRAAFSSIDICALLIYIYIYIYTGTNLTLLYFWFVPLINTKWNIHNVQYGWTMKYTLSCLMCCVIKYTVPPGVLWTMKYT